MKTKTKSTTTKKTASKAERARLEKKLGQFAAWAAGVFGRDLPGLCAKNHDAARGNQHVVSMGAAARIFPLPHVVIGRAFARGRSDAQAASTTCLERPAMRRAADAMVRRWEKEKQVP